jgi:hypothetical protein
MVEDFSFRANTDARHSCCFYWWVYCRRKIKLAVVSLLLNATREYSGHLLKNGGIGPLVEIMAYQTSLERAERTGSSTEDAAAIVPILLQRLPSPTNRYRKS